jgi:hypothetical protein
MRVARSPLTLALLATALVPASAARAHALACRALYADRTATISFFRKSSEVSRTLLTSVVRHHYAADDLIERAATAELDGRPDPALFKEALREYEMASAGLLELQKQLDELIGLHRTGKPVKLFEEALARLLREQAPLPAVALRGQRHSNAAGDAGPLDATRFPQSLLAVLQAQREAAEVVRRQLDETIESLRAVTPRADRGEFMSIVLSGRSGFGDKADESVELLGRLTTLHTSTCSTTIAAAEHAYPAGFEWLVQPSSPPPPISGPPATPSGQD